MNNHKINVAGIAQVVLPFSRLYVKEYTVVRFDISEARKASLNSGTDVTLEVTDITDATVHDIRNTRPADVYHSLKKCSLSVDFYNLWTNPAEVQQEYGITRQQLLQAEQSFAYDVKNAHKKLDDKL